MTAVVVVVRAVAVKAVVAWVGVFKCCCEGGSNRMYGCCCKAVVMFKVVVLNLQIA